MILSEANDILKRAVNQAVAMRYPDGVVAAYVVGVEIMRPNPEAEDGLKWQYLYFCAEENSPIQVVGLTAALSEMVSADLLPSPDYEDPDCECE